MRVGDIVRYDQYKFGASPRDQGVAVVEWDRGRRVFVGKRPNRAQDISMGYMEKHCELIGTVFENPELLKWNL